MPKTTYPSNAILIAILKAIPLTALTSTSYEVILRAASMVDNAIQPNFTPTPTSLQTKTEKISFLEAQRKRAIGIILPNSQKPKPYFKEMSYQQILDWVQINEPQLIGAITQPQLDDIDDIPF